MLEQSRHGLPLAESNSNDIFSDGAVPRATKLSRWSYFVSYILLEISALLAFVKSPSRGSGKATLGQDWIGRAIFFAVLLTVVEAPIVMTLDWLQQITGMQSDPKIPKNLALAMALVVGFGPILEEFIFRAGLRNVTYSLFLGPLVVVLFSVNTLAGFMVLAAMSLLIGLTGFIHARRMAANKVARIRFSRLFISRYASVFWASCSMFALLHLTTFSYNGAKSILVFLFILPQFLSGIVMGYLRLRDGLRSSWLVHFLMNLIALSATALSVV